MSECPFCGLDKNFCRQLANITICQWGSIKNRNKEIRESRDELLSALEVAAQEDEGYMFNDTIQRAQALKKKE